ncbi:MAG: hypothetical protein ABIS01_08035, partial [Ferruginibacter sp.]
ISIQSVTLDHKPYTHTFVRRQDITNGRVLQFEPGRLPETERGLAKEDRPISVSSLNSKHQ